MLLPWFLAVRFLREGRMQTLLIVVGAGAGVTVIVFLSALIGGLQENLIAKTLGTQAHVVIRPPEEVARPLLARDAGAVVISRVERPAQRIRSIDGWQRLTRALERTPGVSAVSPTVSGPAFATRGNAEKSVVLYGVEAARFDAIIGIRAAMIAGEFRVGGTELVIGSELADDLGVALGDKLRIQGTAGRSQLFAIAGVFDLGVRDVNRRWVIASTRAAQTLLDLVGGASTIDLRVAEIFAAEDIARRIEARTGLVVESWMQTNAELLTALRSQSSSSTMIQVFVIIAVAIGIASVLVVSVVQKSREIGILRAMGTDRRTVLATFLIQGGIVGALGSAIGIAGGAGLGWLFVSLARNADGSPLFPIAFGAELMITAALVATGTGIAAAALPARRAARLDPAEAIRNA
ncbi:ABC transporter permease [Haliangium ochraceum]|uniref:ABC3 transporter permease protein domain-containing protein n=1 Tax=Haliangium ochraceum (strain DSM 14365 / JCM 11303 / SMP-2) TaxID=502025 RepID=D0LQE9_HALO1|nr:FtsX-like permease family protein [Haliangium ochraceum]ACY18958.1 protein of unknown function DUF214 [Haliangium ochraceum DSM 14365]